MNRSTITTLFAALLLAAPEAQAQFAVIDVAAIAQLVQEVQTLESQLLTAQNQLAQAQAEYASITGGRGMQNLLAGAPRNYLPSSWGDLEGAMQGGGGALGGAITATVTKDAVLTPQELATLPADVRQKIDTGRRLAALDQNMARVALSTTSERFDSLQTLITALGGAPDQKAVLDLQQRVSAENAMLQNERTKLQTLFQVVAAEERANGAQLREQTVAGLGLFDSRFQPVP